MAGLLDARRAVPFADVAARPRSRRCRGQSFDSAYNLRISGADVVHRAQPIESGRLRLLNTVFGLAHLAQAVTFVLLSNDVSFDVWATFPTGPPGEAASGDRIEVLISYPLGLAVALFSLLSAVFHLLIASPWGWPATSAT